MLDCETATGQEALEMEGRISKRFREFSSVEEFQSPSQVSRLDRIYVRGSDICAIAEIKWRRMPLVGLEAFGSLIISEWKITDGVSLSKKREAPLLVIAGLNDCIVWWKVTDRSGELLFEVEYKDTQTQKNINEPHLQKDCRCGYLGMEYVQPVIRGAW